LIDLNAYVILVLSKSFFGVYQPHSSKNL